MSEEVSSEPVRFQVNGRTVASDARPSTPLLYVLRNDLKLKGVRFGCGVGQCNACMIWMDGKPAQSCLTPLSAAEGVTVTTVEGLPSDGELHPLQAAILDLAAGQCGYCLPGIIMTAAALLRDKPRPGRDDIVKALDAHLCRCGAHMRIIAAVERAAGGAA